MNRTIVLKECNQNYHCKLKQCEHRQPHSHFDTCILQQCTIGNKIIHCRCLKHKYQLVRIEGRND